MGRFFWEWRLIVILCSGVICCVLLVISFDMGCWFVFDSGMFVVEG